MVSFIAFAVMVGLMKTRVWLQKAVLKHVTQRILNGNWGIWLKFCFKEPEKMSEFFSCQTFAGGSENRSAENVERKNF
jgi:hypothetical protein